MPNLNEYYHLLQTEKPPFDDDIMQGILRDALERADTETTNESALRMANQAQKRPSLSGISTATILTGITILALFTLWFVSQKDIPTKPIASEISAPTPLTTNDARDGSISPTSDSGYTSHSFALDSGYTSHSFALKREKPHPYSQDRLDNRTNSKFNEQSDYAQPETEYVTMPTEHYPADSLLPEDFRNWQMPSLLAWSVAERRYNDAHRILDSLLLKRQELPNNKFHLFCLRGHLHKIMDSVKASIADYSYALDMHESSELYMLRGVQYRTANKHQEAFQDFTNAVRLNPYSTQAIFMRGSTAHNIGRLEEACSDWLAAAEMGNTSADSMLKVKCNPTVVQTIRTTQTKRLQAIKTLALLIERTKESIDKTPSSNTRKTPLSLDGLIKKMFSSACDIPTVLMGEASTYCAFQVIHTIALELHDDSLAAMVNSIIQKRNNYSGSLTSQRNNLSTYTQLDAISPSYFDTESLMSATKSNPFLQQRMHDYLMKMTPRYSSRMSEPTRRMENPMPPPHILKTLMQQIEEYCRAIYPEMVAQASNSAETETRVNDLSPPAQQDTDRISQTSINTTHSRTDEATALAPIVPHTNSNIQSTYNSIEYSAPQTTPNNTIAVAKLTEKPYWKQGRTAHRQQYALLGQLTQRAFEQMDTKTTFTQLFTPCSVSSALAGQSTSDCILSLLERQALQMQDSTLQSYVILAQQYRNYRMPSAIKTLEPSIPSDTYTIIPLDKIPSTSPTAYREDIVLRRLGMPTSPSEPPKTNDFSANFYRQLLITIQKHTWKEIDAIEDTTVYYQNAQRELGVNKDIRNTPEWFQELVQERRFLYARNILDSMLSHESNDAELYKLRADINKAIDSLEASIADYSRAISLQESSETYRQRGAQYFNANKHQEAYQDFHNAVRLDPKDAQAVFMRGAAAYNLKRFEEACDDWHLAAQMGHPFADSILEVKCASMLPKYARTAQTEHAEKMKTLALLLERVKQGIGKMQTSYIRSEQGHRFDSLSYKSLPSRCNISTVLMGSASMHCSIHILYTFALDLHDTPLALLVKSLGQQPSNYLSLLSSQTSTNSYDVRTNPFEPYFKMVAQQAQPKSSSSQVINEPVMQITQPSSSSRLLEQIKRTPEQLSLQQKMQTLMQQIEEYCRATYPEVSEK